MRTLPRNDDCAMKNWYRTYTMACMAIIGGVIAYCGSDFGKWPRLTVGLLSHRITLSEWAVDGDILYWGTLVWGVSGAIVGAALGAGIATVVRPTTIVLRLMGAWALGCLLLGSMYVVWSLWPF
jgi:hypothetical protein